MDKTLKKALLYLVIPVTVILFVVPWKALAIGILVMVSIFLLLMGLSNLFDYFADIQHEKSHNYWIGSLKDSETPSVIKPSPVVIKEGIVKKGGVNPDPKTPRPSTAPKGQGSCNCLNESRGTFVGSPPAVSRPLPAKLRKGAEPVPPPIEWKEDAETVRKPVPPPDKYRREDGSKPKKK